MKRILTVLTVLLVLSVPALSWDETGHKLTTYIAWERMTPEVREKVFRLLLAAPEDSDLNVHYDAFNSRSDAVKRRELFMSASIWPDTVRNRAFEVRYKNYHQSDWHYADIFWEERDGRAFILENFPEESGKAIPKLRDFERILRDPSYKPAEKAVALAWFLHVGGDIHNPLHNASRVTELEPKGDQGGNLFVLEPRTETSFGVNLHSYWDGIVGRVKPRKNDACDTDYIAPIARKFMKEHSFGEMSGRLQLGDYKAWNMEGFDLLDEVVYPGVERNRMPSKKYRKRAYRTATEQLVLAGYRLGETLNRIFGPPADETAAAPDLDQKTARAVWERVSALIAANEPFRFIRVEIEGSTVTLKGIVANAELKRKAVEEVRKIDGVGRVVDLIEVDASLLPDGS